MKKKLTKTLKSNLKKTHKAIITFLTTTKKNYCIMKKKIKTIWVLCTLLVVCAIWNACNVTRVMTNESQYFQRGDTAVVIQTKTTETYNAEKKGL